MLEQHEGVQVRQIMRHVRDRVRVEMRAQSPAQGGKRRPRPMRIDIVLACLKTRSTAVESAIRRVGEVPPGPGTLRSRAGALLITVLQRLLFWLIPSIRAADEQLLAAVREQTLATEELLRMLQDARQELEMLKRSQEFEEGLEAALSGTATRPQTRS